MYIDKIPAKAGIFNFMPKKYIKILISILIILITAIFSFVKFTEINAHKSLEFSKIQETFSKEQVVLNNQIVKSDTKKEQSDLIGVTLKVLDKVYLVNVEDGASVYDAMVKIKIENSDFDFKYKEYSSLGIFIYEINGQNGTSGKYWIYYINNKEASVGVSNYILKDGDSILWVQE